MTIVPETPARERREIQRPNRVGITTARADGIPKVKGEFEYASDMRMDGMLCGATLRSPHPRADIWGIDIGPALAIPGVHAVLTHDDVPGRKTYGMEVPDQPVLAINHVRYQGEPVAIVAADHPETARRAADAIVVDYDELEPLTDAEAAMAPGAPELHPDTPETPRCTAPATSCATCASTTATPTRRPTSWSAASTRSACRTRPSSGPSRGSRCPTARAASTSTSPPSGCTSTRTRWRESLGLPPEKVRLTLGGVGGAFGGREDLSMQIHACMLALHTGRPVRMVYNREESFFGHVHRHPCTMRYEHGATRDGRLVFVRARIVLDGGAYASSSTAVCANAACFACGPYEVPNARIDCYVVYTNNPPCGAMRGFGAVQVAFAHEAQMDRLAAALEHGPRRAADPQRHGPRQPHAHGAARRRAGAGGRAARARPCDADAARRAPTACPAASRT